MNRIVSNINALLFKDQMILNYSQSKSEKGKVNLHSYHPELQNPAESGTRNLGDYLSSVVVSFMLEKRDYSLDSSVPKMRHLYAIGSILLMGYQNATIWGTGFP